MQDRFLSALNSIKIALSIVELTYRLEGVLGLEGIVKLFQDEILIKQTLIPSKQISTEDAHDFLFNNLNSGLCSFWIAMDETLDNIFGSKNPESSSHIDDFRAVIYMFRCAYSHAISQPRWRVEKKYLQKYCLLIPVIKEREEVEEFIFDFKLLNGERVKNADFKGLRGVLILENYACNLIRQQSLNLSERSKEEVKLEQKNLVLPNIDPPK